MLCKERQRVVSMDVLGVDLVFVCVATYWSLVVSSWIPVEARKKPRRGRRELDASVKTTRQRHTKQ